MLIDYLFLTALIIALTACCRYQNINMRQLEVRNEKLSKGIDASYNMIQKIMENREHLRQEIHNLQAVIVVSDLHHAIVGVEDEPEAVAEELTLGHKLYNEGLPQGELHADNIEAEFEKAKKLSGLRLSEEGK